MVKKLAKKRTSKKRKSAKKAKTKGRRKSVVKKTLATTRKEKLQQKFLELFPQLWTKTSTAKAIGRDVSTIDKWLKEDPEFRRRFEEEAIPAVADALESDAIKKVLHGIPRPAGFYQGQPVMAPVYNPKTGRPKKGRNGELVMAPVMIREFPTALHSLLLKGWRPERYKDKVEHSGPGGKPLPAGPGVLVFPIGGNSEEFIEGCRKVVEAQLSDDS